MKISGSDLGFLAQSANNAKMPGNRISMNIMTSIGLETDIMKSVRKIVDQVELSAAQWRKDNYNTVNIDGGDGNDTIEASDLVNSKLEGGKGNDKFNLYNVYDSQIDAGEGNDTINIDHASNVTVDAGDGNDVIKISNMSRRLHVFNPLEAVFKDDSVTTYVDGGSGNDTITVITGQKSMLIGGAGNDTIRGYGEIDGGSGDDIISGQGNIKGGTGNDTISGYGTVSGGEGDDIISGSGLIKGDAGNDIINAVGIINGGTGNDIINLISTIRLDNYSGSANIIQYAKGDGHDIVNIANQDTILDMRSISKDEVDIIESINENTGYKELTVNMKDGSGSVTFISNNNNDALYANGVKVKHTLEEQGFLPVTPDKPVTFIPDYIHFSDGVVKMER
jgi:Ca2+-binding RTX toxin-like protein